MPERTAHLSDGWLGVSNRYLAVLILEDGLLTLLLSGALLVAWRVFSLHDWVLLLVVLGVLVAIVSLAVARRRVRAIGYRMREDDLLFKRGIMFERMVAVPYGRMQLIEVSRGPLRRMFGVANLDLVTASTMTQISIPGLDLAAAEDLRDRLVELAESRRAGL